jgi:hypothetical protein
MTQPPREPRIAVALFAGAVWALVVAYIVARGVWA